MSKFIDLTGKRFNKLTVLNRIPTKDGITRWECVCDCGNITNVRGSNLKNGSVKSCGCLIYEKHNTSHMSHTRLGNIYYDMKNRCTNPKDRAYSRYGGRGITICDEWLKSDNFFKWALDNGYKDGLTLDRIDNNKGYSPENCRWATAKEQANNRRSCVMITYNGKTQNLMQWCEELELDYKLIHNRIHKLKWSFEKAVSEPVDEVKRNGRVFEKRHTKCGSKQPDII